MMPSIAFVWLCICVAYLKLCNSFLFEQPRYTKKIAHTSDGYQDIQLSRYYRHHILFMGDHSSATIFQVGDTVTVIEDVMKAGRNLNGLSGSVIETWEKCDVDPTCCCAEWVDEGLSVRVRFNNDHGNELFANDTYTHYFAESELIEKKIDDGDTKQSTAGVAFDGLSCKAFKLDKLSMGEQAKRIAAFEASQKKDI